MLCFEEYETFDATGLADLIAKREISASEALEAALARAHALNPELNALTMLREEDAKQAAEGQLPDGPLSGVPFLLKDLGGEAVDFPANNGSNLLRDTRYSKNSALIDRLFALRSEHLRTHDSSGRRRRMCDRGRGLRRTDAQPPGIFNGPPAAPRADRVPRLRPGSCPRPMAPTAADRCASLRPPAACSASSRPAHACRTDRSPTRAGPAWQSKVS